MDEGESHAVWLGIQEGDGLHTRSWAHLTSWEFHCLLCGNVEAMEHVSTTLFDGLSGLGSLCLECVSAGPAGAAIRTRRHALNLRQRSRELEALADRLSDLGPTRWSTLADQDVVRERFWAWFDAQPEDIGEDLLYMRYDSQPQGFWSARPTAPLMRHAP